MSAATTWNGTATVPGAVDSTPWRTGLATVVSALAALMVATAAVGLGGAPASTVLEPAPVVEVRLATQLEALTVLGEPASVESPASTSDVPASLPSYYSFQWDDACAEECPSRVAID